MGEREKFIKFIDDVKIKEGFTLDKEFADLFNISTSNLAGYKSTRNIPKSWKLWYCKRYDITLNQLEDFLNDRSPKVENTEIIQNQKKLLEYQEKDIERLENKLKHSAEQLDSLKTNPVQSQLWESMTPDFETEVEIKPKLNFFAMGMMIKQSKVINSLKWAKALGITEKKLLEYHDIGKWHEWGKSPIEKLMIKDSKEAISTEIPTLEKIIQFVKNLAGEHYYNQTIVYKHKSNSVVTHCASKIKYWDNPKIVINKCTILKIIK